MRLIFKDMELYEEFQGRRTATTVSAKKEDVVNKKTGALEGAVIELVHPLAGRLYEWHSFKTGHSGIRRSKTIALAAVTGGRC